MSKHNNETNMPGEPPAALIKALRRLLRPLVKLLLSFQISFPFLAEMLKGLYVEVAENDFPLEGKKQTDTRISLLTGVHRKDTKRLRAAAVDEGVTPESISVGAQLVGLWASSPEFLDEHGQPRPLSLKPNEKDSFEALVQSVCRQDMRARVVLDEWLRLGVVSINDDKCVELNVTAFVPENSLDDKAFYLGMNVADHIAAAGHNIVGQEAPMMERCAYYNNLSEESVQQLDEYARQLGMDALQALNKKAQKLKNSDKAKIKRGTLTQANQRVNFGIYFFHEEAPEKE